MTVARLQNDDVAQYQDIQSRLYRLENSRLEVVEVIPTTGGSVDVAVPSDARLVELGFEYEVPFGTKVLLRPNGDATSLPNHLVSWTSVLGSPNVANAGTTSMSNETGLLINGTYGAAGAIRLVGRAEVETSNYSGRTVMRSNITATQTVGSANNYTALFFSQAVYDLTDAITMLRLVTSTGNFNGGVVRARFS